MIGGDDGDDNVDFDEYNETELGKITDFDEYDHDEKILMNMTSPYILKVKKSADFTFQSKKNLRKRCVNRGDKIS